MGASKPRAAEPKRRDIRVAIAGRTVAVAALVGRTPAPGTSSLPAIIDAADHTPAQNDVQCIIILFFHADVA
jgi:hypothetical protein